MKRQTFARPTLRLETSIDWNGRHFIPWRPHVSQIFRDTKAMLRWLKWPKGTPTRQALDEWLEELDADKKPAQEELPAQAGVDPSDPQYQTRTVI